MSESNTRTVWFITGANRGIGLGLVRYILQENEHDVVFAGTRDPAKSNDLNELASEKEGRLFVLELSSESEEQAKAAAQVVKDKIGHVDVVIANAGKLEGNGRACGSKKLIIQQSRYRQLFRARLYFAIA
jgi:NAD(P)-dependent dehydrogenase (short-subunit alcohol dehydrogenase family)